MKSKLKNTRMYIVVKKRQNFVRISNVVKTNPAIDNDYLDYKQARMVFSHALSQSNASWYKITINRQSKLKETLTDLLLSTNS